MERLTIEQQIRDEIYRAFELLGADRALLSIIRSWRSWGDTLDDGEILLLLQQWNAEHARRDETI